MHVCLFISPCFIIHDWFGIPVLHTRTCTCVLYARTSWKSSMEIKKGLIKCVWHKTLGSIVYTHCSYFMRHFYRPETVDKASFIISTCHAWLSDFTVCSKVGYLIIAVPSAAFSVHFWIEGEKKGIALSVGKDWQKISILLNQVPWLKIGRTRIFFSS